MLLKFSRSPFLLREPPRNTWGIRKGWWPIFPLPKRTNSTLLTVSPLFLIIWSISFLHLRTSEEKLHSPTLITFLLQIPVLPSTQNILNIVHVPAVSHLAIFADCEFQRHVSVILLHGGTINVVILPTTFMIKMRFRHGKIRESAL